MYMNSRLFFVVCIDCPARFMHDCRSQRSLYATSPLFVDSMPMTENMSDTLLCQQIVWKCKRKIEYEAICDFLKTMLVWTMNNMPLYSFCRNGPRQNKIVIEFIVSLCFFFSGVEENWLRFRYIYCYRIQFLHFREKIPSHVFVEGVSLQWNTTTVWSLSEPETIQLTIFLYGRFIHGPLLSFICARIR